MRKDKLLTRDDPSLGPLVFLYCPCLGLTTKSCSGSYLTIGTRGNMMTSKLVGFLKRLDQRKCRVGGGVHADCG